MLKRNFHPTLIGFIALAWGGASAFAQSPVDRAQTEAYVIAHQNEDGGFSNAPGQPSTLGATSSSLRILHYIGGAIPNHDACADFVRSCLAEDGGFAQNKGGKTDVVTTAIGLMAAVELKIADKPMIDRASAYFSANAKNFEEVRMAIAGLEAVSTPSNEFPRWLEQIEALRQPDGAFGEGAGKAFASGGAGAAILRMGLPLAKKEAVADAIKTSQRPDGGWSKDDGPADLSSSYRVMRALYMLKEKPDLDRLKAFIASCRQADGSYAVRPDARGDLGATYYAAIMLNWTRALEEQGSLPEPSPYTAIFNGQDLKNWEGNSELWSARDGMLVGKSPGINHNEFLTTRESYGDFILSLRFRVVNGKGNSGVQFRSVRIPGTEMSGYQADLGEGYWASLYDESRRNKTLVKASDEAMKALQPEDWNHYVIFASGDRITLYLNGVASVVYREDAAEIARDGLIAVQIHAGEPMEVQFKELLLRKLP